MVWATLWLWGTALAAPSMTVSDAVAESGVQVYLASEPGDLIVLYASTKGAPTPCVQQLGVSCLSLAGPAQVLGAWVADGHGRATAPVPLPAHLRGQISFEAISYGTSVVATGAVVRPVLAAGSDPDEDGLATARELRLGTDPAISDSDGDGVADGEEVLRFGTDPLVFDVGLVGGGADIDGDGLLDATEFALGTDAWAVDTDGDSLSDGDEVLLWGTDPVLSDSDGDGVSDYEELMWGSEPNDADSDDGGANDGEEWAAGTDPYDAQDDEFAGPGVD